LASFLDFATRTTDALVTCKADDVTARIGVE
jgi:hypothetical protein